MLRAVSRVMLQQVKRPDSLQWGGHYGLSFYPELCSRSISANKLQNHTWREENTMTRKVLDYMRGRPEYATSVASLPGHVGLTSPLNASEKPKTLLRVARSRECNPNDILSFFSQYISQNQNITQDLDTEKKLMVALKGKVLQTIPQMTLEDLKTFSIILKNLNFEKIKYLNDIATNIDKECSRRASMVDLEECLKLFDVLLMLHGNKLHRKKQFDTFMSIFEMHTPKATPHHLVQILHYVGVAKNKKLNQEYVKVLLSKLPEVFELLSFIDAGIALGGMFRSNVKLDQSSELIKHIANCLQVKGEKLNMLNDLESYAFLSMIKVIRAANYKDEGLLRAVGSLVKKSDPNTFQPEVIAHILALYANSKIYDPEVFTKFEHLVIKHLSERSHTVRSKDVSRILWSFCHVGHKLNDNFFEIVEKVLVRLLNEGEFDSYPEHLSGSLFSLAIFGHYPGDLIQEAFKPQRIEKLLSYQRSKQLSRLLGLHEALKTEAPEITVSLPETYARVVPKRTLSDEMQHRPALAKLMKGAKYINKSVGSHVIDFKFPVPFINYASLIYDTRGLKIQNIAENFVLEEVRSIMEVVGVNRVAFEVVDSHSLIVGSRNLIGILKLKLRLMNQSGWPVYTIFEDDVNRFNSDEKTMAAFILDALSKIKT